MYLLFVFASNAAQFLVTCWSKQINFLTRLGEEEGVPSLEASFYFFTLFDFFDFV